MRAARKGRPLFFHSQRESGTPESSHRHDGHVTVFAEEAREIIGVGCQQRTGSGVARRCGGNERIDAIVDACATTHPSCQSRRRFVRREQSRGRSREDTENSVHLGVARPVARRAFDENGCRDDDASVVLDEPAQPAPRTLRWPAERRERAAIEDASRARRRGPGRTAHPRFFWRRAGGRAGDRPRDGCFPKIASASRSTSRATSASGAPYRASRSSRICRSSRRARRSRAASWRNAETPRSPAARRIAAAVLASNVAVMRSMSIAYSKSYSRQPSISGVVFSYKPGGLAGLGAPAPAAFTTTGRAGRFSFEGASTTIS